MNLLELAQSQIVGRAATDAEIARYLGPEYKPGYAWCAGFAAWCLVGAGYVAPESGPGRRGARALVRSVALHGQWVIEPGTLAFDLGVLQPGDVACWRRKLNSWQCHVALIECVSGEDITTIGGNERRQVRRSTIAAAAFATRFKGLYGVARPRKAG